MTHKKRKRKKVTMSPRTPLPLWDLNDIRRMSTDLILEKLASFGITTSPADFVRDAESHDLAETLSKEWWNRFDCTAQGRDEDFPWMAALVLWERLLPGEPCLEMIHDRIEDGYDELGEEGEASPRACHLWLEAWEMLKTRLTPDMTRMTYVDDLFSGFFIDFTQLFQDMESGLNELAPEDPSYHERRIRFSQEVCAQFQDEEEEVLSGFYQAEAESLWKLGRRDEANRSFEKLIGRFADDLWGYTAWADCYVLTAKETPPPEDLDKAESIYQMALANPRIKEEKAGFVFHDLSAIYHLRGNEEQAERYEAMSKASYEEGLERALERRSSPPSIPAYEPSTGEAPPPHAWTPAIRQPIRSSIKRGRNDPCWCGTGKKYKKCHLDADQQSARTTGD